MCWWGCKRVYESPSVYEMLTIPATSSLLSGMLPHDTSLVMLRPFRKSTTKDGLFSVFCDKPFIACQFVDILFIVRLCCVIKLWAPGNFLVVLGFFCACVHLFCMTLSPVLSLEPSICTMLIYYVESSFIFANNNIIVKNALHLLMSHLIHFYPCPKTNNTKTLQPC